MSLSAFGCTSAPAASLADGDAPTMIDTGRPMLTCVSSPAVGECTEYSGISVPAGGCTSGTTASPTPCPTVGRVAQCVGENAEGAFHLYGYTEAAASAIQRFCPGTFSRL